jgi:tetratricopeptide (TPR) repeat protein
LLTKLVKEDPQNQDYWFELGEAYDDQSTYEAALTCYQKCIEFESSLGTTFAPTAYNNIGRIYSKKADYKKAREYFETALQLGSPLAKDNLEILDRIENSHKF